MLMALHAFVLQRPAPLSSFKLPFGQEIRAGRNTLLGEPVYFWWDLFFFS